MPNLRLPNFITHRRDILAGVGFVAVALLVVLAGILAWNHFIKTPPYIDPHKYPIRGIDISAHNGDVDFEEVARSGISFVFIKASEGVDFRDSLFRTNYHNAMKAGLKTGAYHFFRFDGDGIRQAQNIAHATYGCTPDMGIVIDVEDHGNVKGVSQKEISERLASMVEFLQMLGHKVLIYTNKDGYFEYVRKSVPGAPLWICSFSQTPINAEWTFWQYNHHGHVPGIKTEVDLNVFCGKEREWKNFLKGEHWPYDNTQ